PSPRPTPRTRTAPRWPGRGSTTSRTGPDARPVDWWCSSTGRSSCTWNAAAAPCSPSTTIRTRCVPRHPTSPPHPEHADSRRSPSRRSTAPASTAPRSPSRCRRPVSSPPRAATLCARRPEEALPVIKEFFIGIRFLGRGFGYWRLRPRLMILGLIPGLIALALLIAALLPLLLSLGTITTWLTPFADGWDPFWATALRSAIGVVIAIGSLVLAGVFFTALALLIGDPFYQRIWRPVENDLG